MAVLLTAGREIFILQNDVALMVEYKQGELHVLEELGADRGDSFIERVVSPGAGVLLIGQTVGRQGDGTDHQQMDQLGIAGVCHGVETAHRGEKHISRFYGLGLTVYDIGPCTLQNVEKLFFIVTVSYTHLDVYERQQRGRR